jgi:HAD superfamily hydrolase (TIGR01509 family)
MTPNAVDKMSPARRFSAVVFDMDGLMFNTEEVYYLVGIELLRRRGQVFTRELSDAMMGRPPKASFETMIAWHKLGDTWEQLADESGEIYVGLLDEHLAPMPGLLPLLDALEAAGLPKAIATSGERRLVEAVLSRFAMRPRFRFVLTSADIEHGKPHPEIYLKAVEQFDARPEEILVLEDSENGCRAAAAAGTFAVAVPWELSRSHDFGAASLVIDGLEDRRLYEVLGIEDFAGSR